MIFVLKHEISKFYEPLNISISEFPDFSMTFPWHLPVPAAPLIAVLNRPELNCGIQINTAILLC